jgi:uncharacterized protein YndB with AHSA1/START domain
MSVEIHDGITVRISRSFDHPPETLFAAFTDPHLAAQWMWAGIGSLPYAEIDLRIGGRYRVAITADPDDDTWPGEERAMRGVYLQIEPNRRLVYTLHWDADVGYNRPCLESIDEAVIVDIQETGTGCSLSFTHAGLPGDARSAEAHAQGTQASFDVLNAMLDEQA